MFEFINGSIEFPERVGAPVAISHSLPSLTRPVRSGTTPVVLLTGFRYEFSQSRGDHPLGRVAIDVAVEGVSGAVVTVRGHLGVRDWSPTEFFYPYGGSIDFVVIADIGE